MVIMLLKRKGQRSYESGRGGQLRRVRERVKVGETGTEDRGAKAEADSLRE